MNAAEHRAEAAALLEKAATPGAYEEFWVAKAQVHATLALSALEPDIDCVCVTSPQSWSAPSGQKFPRCSRCNGVLFRRAGGWWDTDGEF